MHAARIVAPVHVRGPRLADTVDPPHSLGLHSGVKQGLHQEHVLHSGKGGA